MVNGSACAKLILCGEYSVMYGRPAIALPVSDVRTLVSVTQGQMGSGLHFSAPNLGRNWSAADVPNDPLSELALATLRHLAFSTFDLSITLTSSIPIASGMGSSAATATALVRALTAYLGRSLPSSDIAALVYISEQRYHGRPSGIDNTVIAYEQPIWFVRASVAAGNPQISKLVVAVPFTLVIGNTGVHFPTLSAFNDFRQRLQTDPPRYEILFDRIGILVKQVRDALASGDIAAVGPFLNEDQDLLEQIGASSPELDRLITAARRAGALGAKLSGAGRGGVMLALVTEASRAAVVDSLRIAGAVDVLETTVGAASPSPQQQ